MPIYELHCQSCGHEFEELVFRQSEVERLTCSKCGATKIELRISACSGKGSRKGSAGRSTGSCGSSGGFS
jgi:putative FmdB family regulatory protein